MYLRRHFLACVPAKGAVSVAVTASTPFLFNPCKADWTKGVGVPKGSMST